VSPVEADGQRAARLIEREIEVFGIAPTWGELAEAFGWSRARATARFPELRHAGWITYSNQPRSLRPGRKWGWADARPVP
jgi:hypothetical protein